MLELALKRPKLIELLTIEGFPLEPHGLIRLWPSLSDTNEIPALLILLVRFLNFFAPRTAKDQAKGIINRAISRMTLVSFPS